MWFLPTSSCPFDGGDVGVPWPVEPSPNEAEELLVVGREEVVQSGHHLGRDVSLCPALALAHAHHVRQTLDLDTIEASLIDVIPQYEVVPGRIPRHFQEVLHGLQLLPGATDEVVAIHDVEVLSQHKVLQPGSQVPGIEACKLNIPLAYCVLQTYVKGMQ